jgi:hypothetical protein
MAATPPTTTTASYTDMKGDVEAIGSHCQMAYCHVLDFLPFRCESCKGFVYRRTIVMPSLTSTAARFVSTIGQSTPTNAPKKANGHAKGTHEMPRPVPSPRNPPFTTTTSSATTRHARRSSTHHECPPRNATPAIAHTASSIGCPRTMTVKM